MWRHEEGFLRRHPRLVFGSAVALCVYWWIHSAPGCFSLWLKGIDVPQCPEGDVRVVATIDAPSVQRDHEARIHLGALAYFAKGANEMDSRPVKKAEASLSLVDHTGTETTLADAAKFQADTGGYTATIKVPVVADGDYLLRGRVKTAFGESTVDAPIGFYAPARVHVLTDRPLYQPGQTIRFRAVVLRAHDLSPLEGRPGKWVVTDPGGQVVLEERAPSGAWGVSSGTFPLDSGASTGAWKIQWSSGNASDEVLVKVEPFTVPRFHVEAATERAFYRPGEKPALRGAARYSSGAPVSAGRVRITWTHEGPWPVPTEWEEDGLPSTAATDKDGAFRLTLPEVPDDLRGRNTLSAAIVVTDMTGDSIASTAPVLLSEDGIQVSAVTELPNGLVEGLNNRLYLRVTDPADKVLSGADVHIRRAWDPSDRGIDAMTDEDGVAEVQIDPGPAVNVVVPPMPMRSPPLQNAVIRTGLMDLLAGSDAPLSIVRALDSVQPHLQSCARFARSDISDLVVDLHAIRDGRIEAAAEIDDLAARCLARTLADSRLSLGDGVYQAKFDVTPPLMPDLRVSVEGGSQAFTDSAAAFDVWAMDARSCLPRSVEAGPYPEQLVWSVEQDSQDIEQTWKPRPGGVKLPAAVISCVRNRFADMDLDAPAARAGVGVMRLDITPAPRSSNAAPQATTMLGYELAVSARTAGREVGSTKLRMTPGQVPPLRLRATPVLARAGDSVDVELLRGPSFAGNLPNKLVMKGEKGEIETGVDAKTHVARFHLPPGAEGWFTVSWSGAEARVFVRPQSPLAVSVEPDKTRYAPGDKATLRIHTLLGSASTEAAVGLFGVDESLGQLVLLPGANDMDRLRPRVEMAGEAFPQLDGQALTMGRVRGAHAAAAIVARIARVPTQAELDSPVSATASGTIDPQAELTDAFYGVLNELHTQAREWEEHAKDKMHPSDVVKLWNASISACEKRGERVTDSFHRPLRLSRLPQNLLELTDPRALVTDGAHLPEDVENWAAYVAKEQP